MKNWILYIVLFFTFGNLYADEDVKFSVNAPNVVRQGQQFRLVYTVNTRIDDFQAPRVESFSVLAGPSKSTSTNISIINGKMTRQYTLKFTYILRANETGKFSISPAKVEKDGKIYQSDPVDIEVIKSSGGAQTQKSDKNESAQSHNVDVDNEDLFVRVFLNKQNVRRQEPVVATIKIYTKLNLSGFENVKFPDFDGFYKYEIETPPLRQLQEENINGQIYGTGVLKKFLLFPQKAKKITIDPFEVDCIVQKKSNSRSQSIFDDFFGSYRNVKIPLSSKPVTLDVKSLPGSKPNNFTGGVGDFTISASLDKNKVKTNESVNLNIEISGEGNLKIMDVPEVDFPPDLETYEPKIENNIDISASGAKGNKKIEYLIIPRHEGEFRVPPVSFSYFDLSENKYKTLSAGPFNLNVTKGDGDTTATVTSFSKKDISVIDSDIRFIKTEKFKLKEKGKFIFGSLFFFLVYGVSVAAFILILLIRRKKIRENSDIELLKNKKANKFAKKRLKVASRYLKENEKDRFYEETLKALWGYLSDKLSIPVAELSREKADEKLEEKGIEQDIRSQFLQLLDDCEFARYAPSASEERMDRLYKHAVEIISKLQQRL
jgi:hypothetical protein